jgi:RNA polymerase sigma-70 factor (ECF subfamily)
VTPDPSNCPALPPDIDLLGRNESNDWFLEQVHPHESVLRRWLRGRFPWLTDIDDLVQESYARILRAKQEGRVGHAKSYLFITARNAAYDQARRNQVLSIESVAEMATFPVIEELPGAREILTRDQELEILAAAIESLPRRCRLVVKLRKLRGLSYQEIAQQLGISVHTVNAQLTKGMTLCRSYLRRNGVVRDEP